MPKMQKTAQIRPLAQIQAQANDQANDQGQQNEHFKTIPLRDRLY